MIRLKLVNKIMGLKKRCLRSSPTRFIYGTSFNLAMRSLKQNYKLCNIVINRKI